MDFTIKVIAKFPGKRGDPYPSFFVFIQSKDEVIGKPVISCESFKSFSFKTGKSVLSGKPHISIPVLDHIIYNGAGEAVVHSILPVLRRLCFNVTSYA